MKDREQPSVITVVAARLALVWLLLMTVGGYSAALGWRPGGFMMLGGVCGNITGHLLVGFTEYPRAMRRPWPAVSPLEDEDEW
jgi:hypothetical protein